MGLPTIEIRKDFNLPRTTPVAPSPASPVKIGFGGRLSVKGTATPPVTNSKVTASNQDGRLQVDVEQSFQTEFGVVKFKEQIQPGQVSKIGIEIGRTGIPVTVEFAANADYSRPISIVVKWPNAIRLDSAKLKVAGFGIGEDWTFSGALDPQVEINFVMNELWPGWTNLLRLMAQQARSAAQGGVTAIRAVYFAGELGTISTAGVAATASGVALVGIAWVAAGLYACGKALTEGRGEAVLYAFSNGYARMLADMTSDNIKVVREAAAPLLAIDWKSQLAARGRDFANGTSSELGESVERLGRAAILQDIDRFIRDRGPTGWTAVSKKHQAAYGAQGEARRNRYLNILYQQVEARAPNLGIRLL